MKTNQKKSVDLDIAVFDHGATSHATGLVEVPLFDLAPPADPRAFVVWFQSLHEEHLSGAKYFPAWSRDVKMVKTRLANYGEKRLKVMATAMMRAPDKYPFDGTDRGITTLYRLSGYIDQRLRAHGI